MCLLLGKASEKSLEILENVMVLLAPSLIDCSCEDPVQRQFLGWAPLLKPYSCFAETVVRMVPWEEGMQGVPCGAEGWVALLCSDREKRSRSRSLRAHRLNSEGPH